MVVLNRHLLGSSVPTFSYSEISEKWEHDEELESSHPFALAELRRFGASFDPRKFSRETGQSFGGLEDVPSLLERIGPGGETECDLGELRWALWLLVCGPQYQIDGPSTDRILDGIHYILTGAQRATSGPGPYEPWLGTEPMRIGSGQRRFWLYTGPIFDRERIFDFVAGLMLRHYGERFVARSLGLYPPAYSPEKDGPVQHVFMILIHQMGAAGQGLPEGDQAEQEAFAEWAQRMAVNAEIGVVPPPD